MYEKSRELGLLELRISFIRKVVIGLEPIFGGEDMPAAPTSRTE